MNAFRSRPGGRKGAFLLFIFLAILVLGSVLIISSGETMSRKVFYLNAARALGFVDERGRLRGLLDVEKGSMQNLAFAAIRAFDKESSPKMFLTRMGSRTPADLHDTHDIWGIIGRFIRKDKIKHNHELEVDMKILPLDTKIPFTNRYKSEILDTMKSILDSLKKKHGATMSDGDVKTFIGNIEKILTIRSCVFSESALKSIRAQGEGYTKSECKKAREGLPIIFSYVPVTEARLLDNLESLNSLCRGFDSQGKQSFLTDFFDLLEQSIAFEAVPGNEIPRGINFFLANKHVQKAVCGEFCRYYSQKFPPPPQRVPSQNQNPAPAPQEPPRFSFNADGELKLDSETLRSLNLMYEKASPRGLSREQKNYTVNAVSQQASVPKQVFLLKDTSGGFVNFSSYSQSIELIMGVWDSECGIGTKDNLDERCVCELSD